MLLISSVNDIDFDLFDEVWYITATNPNMRCGCIHHPELAPSKNLFNAYKAGTISKDDYFRQYSSELTVKELKLHSIAEMINSGKNIQAVCYCPEYEDCHRSVFFRHMNVIVKDCYLK